MMCKTTLAGVLLLFAPAFPAAAADDAAEALKSYRSGMKELEKLQADYRGKPMQTDLRAAVNQLISPWWGMTDPEGEPYWRYEHTGFDQVFASWGSPDMEKGTLAIELAKAGGENVARELFERLRRTAKQIVAENQLLKESRGKFFIWLHDQQPAVRRRGAYMHFDALVEALGALRDEAAVTYLSTLAWKKAKGFDRRAKWPLLRVALIDALARSGTPKALALVDEAAQSPEPQLRIAALEGLAESESSDRDVLRAWLLDTIQHDRCYAVRAAALALLRDAVPDVKAVPQLADALVLPRRPVERFDVVETLGALTGKHLGTDADAWRSWYDQHRSAIEKGTWKRSEPENNPTVTAGDPGVIEVFGIPTRARQIVVIVKASAECEYIPLDVEKALKKNLKYWSLVTPKQRDYVAIWDYAQRELLELLERLPRDVRFNFVFLHASSKMTWVQPKMALAKPGIVKRALKKVRSFKPGGWGPLLPAIWASYARAGAEPWGSRIPDEPLVDAIFVVGDCSPVVGPIQTTSAIVDDLRRRHRFMRIPVHCIRAGPFAISTELLKAVTELTGGTYRFQSK